MTETTLTGIKPTGTPHIGNYLGAIKPALELVDQYESYFFIADYHALTAIKDKEKMKQYTTQTAAIWLAAGLDKEKSIFYKQSDISEIYEFAWILSCFTAKGLLNRAHAYKSKVDENNTLKRDTDEGINQGLFSYPVLMAADILLFDANKIPIGKDQVQHIEIARDIALQFNKTYGEILHLPTPIINKDQTHILGLDGQKMSKNYNNTIPMFAEKKEIEKKVMKIKTDSKGVQDKKCPKTCLVLQLYKHFAQDHEIKEKEHLYLEGNIGYGQVKKELAEKIINYFAKQKEKYDQFYQNPKKIDQILEKGALKAQKKAKSKLKEIKKIIGIKDN